MPIVADYRHRTVVPKIRILYFNHLEEMRLGFPVCIRCGGQVVGLSCLQCSQGYEKGGNGKRGKHV